MTMPVSHGPCPPFPGIPDAQVTHDALVALCRRQAQELAQAYDHACEARCARRLAVLHIAAECGDDALMGDSTQSVLARAEAFLAFVEAPSNAGEDD